MADLNRWATDELTPDLTVLLDVPATAGLARARDVDEPDRLEAAGRRFHSGSTRRSAGEPSVSPERYLVLDATRARRGAARRHPPPPQRVLPAEVADALAAATAPPPAPEPEPEPEPPDTPPEARRTQPVTNEQIAAAQRAHETAARPDEVARPNGEVARRDREVPDGHHDDAPVAPSRRAAAAHHRDEAAVGRSDVASEDAAEAEPEADDGRPAVPSWLTLPAEETSARE